MATITIELPDRPDLPEDAERDEWIVRLRKAGATTQQIGDAFCMSRFAVGRVYRRMVGARYDDEKKKHRRALYADLELLTEKLRWIVHDDAIPPDNKLIGRFLQACRAKALLMALDEPKEDRAQIDIGLNFSNPVALEKAARLAAWVEMQTGRHPPPPASIIEARPELAARYGSAIGSHPGSQGDFESSWAQVAANLDTSVG